MKIRKGQWDGNGVVLTGSKPVQACPRFAGL
jgi:hypothetical protein